MSTPRLVLGPLPAPAESFEDKLAAFDSVPLFMKSLPTENTDDAILSALQSLAHEGTPDEVAQNFREQGNEYFKGKRYREALGFYTQAVDAKPADPALLEIILCNRAACNVELKNYGTVLRDCSRALSLNPRSSKAYYRSALALIALDRSTEALDCCVRCLSFDADNKGVQIVHARAIKAKEGKDRQERAKMERLENELETKRQMDVAFRERGLIVRSKPDGSDNPYSPHFDPEDPTKNRLILPVFFLYPQHATSDVIPEFVEDTSFAAHISTMFPPQAPPPDWDPKGEYIDGQLVIYAVTRRKRLLKVGEKMSLRDVCSAAKDMGGTQVDGMEIKDGCLMFVVLPKGDAEKKWLNEYKAIRDE